MGNLSTLSIKTTYRSDTDNLIKDFYGPCMYNAILFQRAVGYFTSTSLAYAVSGIAHLVAGGGKIFLIASPHLTIEDINAINKGYQNKKDVILTTAGKNFNEIKNLLISERLEALAWLIATGKMEVKLAIRQSSDNRIACGIYHEKIGLFSDDHQNVIAFIGSANETASGLLDNFESIDVYVSWDDPQQRVLNKVDIFNRLWNNQTRGLSILEFTEATADILKPYCPSNIKQYRNRIKEYLENENNMNKKPEFPDWLTLRDYQEEAVKNWFKNNGRGCLKMATGSGKTITALAIVTHLYQKVNLQAAIILCPFKHLVDQWETEAKKFNFDPVIVHTSRNIWLPQLTNKLAGLKGNKMLMVITTNNSFCKDVFQNKLEYLPMNKTIFIADEAHNLGAENIRTKLPLAINWRLALSATPERWFDEEGTQVILDYFGEVLQPEFSLKDALQMGALVPYYYHPILVELTREEQVAYFDLSEKIARVMDKDKLIKENIYLSQLLIKRSRLIASAENKLIKLKELMQNKTDTYHWLFYCGDGTVGYPTTEDEQRQIEAVCQILGRKLDMKINIFTAETPGDERRQIIRQLDSEVLQGLVAIRCLDEGIDIPSTQRAVILASSSNPRQFIQRRGRVLRKAEGKKFAEIYDMIITPPVDSKYRDIERQLLRKEFIRFAEFADLAINQGIARKEIFELQKKYDLMDI